MNISMVMRAYIVAVYKSVYKKLRVDVEAIAISEDNEEKRVFLNSINHIIEVITASIGVAANKSPNIGATPFPPLNFNHIGNICPIIIQKPEKAAIGAPNKYFIMSTGTKLFIVSKKNVSRPNFLPLIRQTLVDPILPDPIFLGSLSPKILLISTPNGIEPHK